MLQQQQREEGRAGPPKPRGRKPKAVAAEKPCEGETKKFDEVLFLTVIVVSIVPSPRYV